MATVKTAISLESELFRKATRAARKAHVSRSRLVAQALEEHLKRLENQELLERVNASYSGEPDVQERRFLDAARKKLGKKLAHDPW